jgi:hypothetical protein
MDDHSTVAAPRVPAQRRHRDTVSVQVTCEGAGSPPLPVLARVQHVFCGPVAAEVWPMLRRELRAGSITAGDLVLLRIGRGPEETWRELSVAG